MKTISIADLSEYFNEITRKPNIFHDGLEAFYSITGNMKDIYEESSIDYDAYYSLKRVSIMDNLELVKEFYKEINFDVNVDDLVADGTIDFIEQDSNICFLKGLSNYTNSGFNQVTVWETNNLLDGIVLVHELSHKRDISRTYTKEMFTEGLAFAEERMYVDFLEKKGYKDVKKVWNNIMNVIVYDMYKIFFANIKIYLLFKNIGSIDRESYKYYYEDDSDYDEIIDTFTNENNLDHCCIYSFGYAVSLLIYDKFINGELSSKDMNDLHNMMSENIGVVLKKIGLDFLSSKGREEMYKAAKKYYIKDKKEELVIKH